MTIWYWVGSRYSLNPLELMYGMSGWLKLQFEPLDLMNIATWYYGIPAHVVVSETDNRNKSNKSIDKINQLHEKGK